MAADYILVSTGQECLNASHSYGPRSVTRRKVADDRIQGHNVCNAVKFVYK